MPKYLTYSNALLDFSANIQSSAVIALKQFAYCNNQTSAISHRYKDHKVDLQIKYPEVKEDT